MYSIENFLVIYYLKSNACVSKKGFVYPHAGNASKWPCSTEKKSEKRIVSDPEAFVCGIPERTLNVCSIV
jgi:hypothetical protein